MLGLEDHQNHLPCLGSDVLWLVESTPLPVSYPIDYGPELLTQNEARVSPLPLLFWVILPCHREEFLTRVYGFLGQNFILASIPRVHTLDESPPYYLHAINVKGAIE